MPFRCPVCGFVAENLIGLKRHFRLKHRKLNHCPICNKPVRNLNKHSYFCSLYDDQHAILFYLTCTKSTNTKYKSKCRDLAYKYLWVG